MNRAEILRRLAEKIVHAKVACEHTRRAFIDATGILDDQQPAPAERIREIGNEYRNAIEVSEKAYREQIDFIIDGIVPDWLRVDQ